MTEIKLVNGNTIKIIPTKEEVKRGNRVKLYPVDEYMGFKLKWHQKLRMSIYDLWFKLTYRWRIR